MTHKVQFSERLQHLLHDRPLPASFLAFSAAVEIVQKKSAQLLGKLPLDIQQEVLAIAKAYEEDGEYIDYSNVGKADHTTMAKALYELLVREHILAA